jgi:hypothetical protein
MYITLWFGEIRDAVTRVSNSSVLETNLNHEYSKRPNSHPKDLDSMFLSYSLIRSDLIVRLLHNLDIAGSRMTQKKAMLIKVCRNFRTQNLGEFLTISHDGILEHVFQSYVL